MSSPDRGRPTGRHHLKVRLKTAKQRTASSQRWLERQLNDPYVAAAQREGYRSRAAYKLIEIDDKYHLLRPGRRVVDLGAAPGGWSQVAAARVRSLAGRGQVVAIDVLAMEPLPGVVFLEGDFMAQTAPARLKALLREGGADVVLSDMAAQGTGHSRTDHLRIMALAEAAAEFAMRGAGAGWGVRVQGVPGRHRTGAARSAEKSLCHRAARQATCQPCRVG